LLAALLALAAVGQEPGGEVLAIPATTSPENLAQPSPEMPFIPVASRGPNTSSTLPDFEEFEATAYDDFGLTQSGIRVCRGMIAADPTVLPIGSVVEIVAGEYSGIYTVMDTGALVKGRIIDIYVGDREEAVQFGRQSIRLRVLRLGWQPDPGASSAYTLAG